MNDIKTQYARGYATVDLDKIRRNMEHMKANLQKDTKMFAVIKTDGYGHGAVPIARELEVLDFVCGFAVATPEEAHILRKAGITKPLLILGYAFPYSYKMIAEEEFRPAVFREDTLSELSQAASSVGKTIKIHIKVDTGMSRIGIPPTEEGFAFIEKALHTEGIEVEGIFTHFATADEADKKFALQQLDTFKSFCHQAEERFHYVFLLKHCSNSAGIVELKDANMDAVRAGITLYGLWPSSEVAQDIVPLEAAMELKSTIAYIKTVPKGTAISYGRTYITEEAQKIATIPLGYGDGYPRSLSNKGYVLIRGKRVPIAGRICMDQFMVDVTALPEVCPGDEVTLLGQDGSEIITMEELGDISGRFNYEFACDIGKRIPRIYIKNNKPFTCKNYFHDYE